jgi:hypothetical protein
MQMPNLYTHLDPGHLSQFADRTLIGADETVTEKLKRKRKRVSACFNGKGGTRTLVYGLPCQVMAISFCALFLISMHSSKRITAATVYSSCIGGL